MDDRAFMALAVEEAYKGMKEGDGGPFGAVLAKDGQVLAAAHNSVLRDNDPTRHAEILAISRASRAAGSFDLSGCSIYTTTEPCPMCFSAIHWARIGILFYGTTIEDAAKLGFNEMTIPARGMKDLGGSAVEIRSGFMREECEELLRRWDELPGKRVY